LELVGRDNPRGKGCEDGGLARVFRPRHRSARPNVMLRTQY
jgi:hypothetical protein